MHSQRALAALLGGALASACGAPRPAAPGAELRLARDLAMRALASAGGVESPRALVAALPADRVCPGESLEIRVRCHLTRPSARVSAERAPGGWMFILTMPELSDHVHRARVWLGPGGTFALQVESEN
jgi:hypothetical protein